MRINSAAFDHIRANTLYNIEGLEAQLKQAQTDDNVQQISFPKTAKEVRANWLEVTNPTAAQLARFHWRKIDNRTFVF